MILRLFAAESSHLRLIPAADHLISRLTGTSGIRSDPKTLPGELAQKFDHRLVYFLGAFLLRLVPTAGQYDLAAKLWSKVFEAGNVHSAKAHHQVPVSCNIERWHAYPHAGKGSR